MKTGNFLKN